MSHNTKNSVAASIAVFVANSNDSAKYDSISTSLAASCVNKIFAHSDIYLLKFKGVSWGRLLGELHAPSLSLQIFSNLFSNFFFWYIHVFLLC